MCIALAAAVISSGCLGPREISEVPATSERVEELWAATVQPYLEQPLWLDAEAYDAGNYLMVPLHAAFETSNDEWLEQFDVHFSAYVDHIGDTDYANRLNEMQYLYLASEYVALSSKAGEQKRMAPALREHIVRRVIAIWATEPAVTWEHEPFMGIRERLTYKLSLDTPRRSYYRAVVDEDLLLFGIAATLRRSFTASMQPVPPEVDEILDAASQVFATQVRWDNDTWLLQPGVWADHPDYAYAGCSVTGVEMTRAPIPGVATDTSHSHRLPLILHDLREGSRSRDETQMYTKLLDGLEQRMFDYVLVPPSQKFKAWRTTNYMDGNNGYFRWGYATQGANKGYAPYELSGTLNLGSWAFLGTERMRQVYHHQADVFPLPQHIVDTYVGPNSTRSRNPLVALPQCYENGMMELLVRLAATL